LAFPSLAEGFGLPVLEAMTRGLPVACSNVSALPEVAGDAAVLFDPESVNAIGAAIRRLLADDALRADLIARGRARAAAFSWEATAAGTVASYRRVLS
jgi:alpha-1,3-rhamnosyl/mannosyltransferase